MGKQRRRQQSDTAADETLRDLLGTPLPTQRERAPVALRSVQQQRKAALAGYRLRNWVDTTLAHTERLILLLVLLLLAGGWFEFYGRDWLYYRLNPNPPSQPSVAYAAPPAVPPSGAMGSVAATVQPVPAAPAALPYETDAMRGEVDYNDYIAPRPPVLVPGMVDPRPYRLQIPRLGLDSGVVEVYVERGAWQVADYAVGYHHGSGLPGDPGNVVLSGHAGLRGAVFRGLGALRPGDEVLVSAGQWLFTYRVRGLQQVWPHETGVMAPTAEPVLTLITCTAWDRQRLIVIADLVGSQPAS